MDQQQLSDLQERYHDYFVVEHSIRINVRPCPEPEPDDAAFEAMIPEPFRMAGELAFLDKSALKSLNKLGELAEELANYLRVQAKKIDSMMRYILLQQDDATQRFYSTAYGGSALCYLSPTPIEPGTLLEVKLFLADNDGAVYCLARVIAAEALDAQRSDAQRSDAQETDAQAIDAAATSASVATQYQIKATYCRIREQDRELIVRASLHEQSRQLKRKAEQRALR